MNNYIGLKPHFVRKPSMGKRGARKLYIPRAGHPEYCVVRVDQNYYNDEGELSTATTWIGGKLKDMKSLKLSKIKTLPGHIIIIKSLTPHYVGHTLTIDPRTGNSLGYYTHYEYTDKPGNVEIKDLRGY